MKRTTPVAASILLAAALCSGCALPLERGAAGNPGSLADRDGWTDDRGAAVSLGDFSGRPYVLTMFYTSCTVRCPLTIAKLRALDEALLLRHEEFPIVVVTLDFQQDTPDRLARFKRSHSIPGHWHLLHGDGARTRALAARLGERVAYDDAHIDHDVRFAVVDRDGRISRMYEGWSFDVAQAVSGL